MPRGITSFASCAWNKPGLTREALVLLVLAGVLAILTALWHPWAPDSGDWEIPLAEATGKPWLWVDARSNGEFLSGHVPGAVNVNEDDWEAGLQKLMSIWRPGRPILVYCSTARCRSSHTVARRIRKSLGNEEVQVLQGGWEAWQQNPSR